MNRIKHRDDFFKVIYINISISYLFKLLGYTWYTFHNKTIKKNCLYIYNTQLRHHQEDTDLYDLSYNIQCAKYIYRRKLFQWNANQVYPKSLSTMLHLPHSSTSIFFISLYFYLEPHLIAPMAKEGTTVTFSVSLSNAMFQSTIVKELSLQHRQYLKNCLVSDF